jgi:hypothetical protein
MFAFQLFFSATIVISYVMKKKKISLWEAFDEVENIRGIIHPNVGFIQVLVSCVYSF